MIYLHLHNYYYMYVGEYYDSAQYTICTHVYMHVHGEFHVSSMFVYTAEQRHSTTVLRSHPSSHLPACLLACVDLSLVEAKQATVAGKEGYHNHDRYT